MYVLGLDTATAIASVGIASVRGAVVERSVIMTGSHASTLLPLIDDVLSAAALRLRDLTRIAVSIGPGSFTGLRIGLSVAKGLAVATGLPLSGVPTLEAYAHAVGPCDGTVWPVLDARKGEVYAAAYRWRHGEPICAQTAIAVTAADLVARLQGPCTLVGDGVDAYAARWATAPGVIELIPLARRPPSGAVVALRGMETAGSPLAALEPMYCRAAEAEVHRQRRLAELSTG